jgi:tRNA A22 N-methylase
MKIKFNNKVFAFLYEKLDKDIDKIYEILDTAIYHADQNVSSQAVRLGRMFQFQEKAVLASKKVAEIIETNWGAVDFDGLPATQYCELAQK